MTDPRHAKLKQLFLETVPGLELDWSGITPEEEVKVDAVINAIICAFDILTAK